MYKYLAFEEFKRKRYEQPAYDYSSNPLGFNRFDGSDISAHLPFLEFLARQCKVITEFGTRDCFSTSAFIAGCQGIVYSYDIDRTVAIDLLSKIDKPCNWTFYQKSTIAPDTEVHYSDLIFIDSLHSYEQVSEELHLHSDKARKWLLFHDTVSFPPVIRAIMQFIGQHPEWKIVYNAPFNHGLILLEKS